jgi:hypothetical protein
MRFDVLTEFLRPRELPASKEKNAKEFLAAVEGRGLKKIRSSVKLDKEKAANGAYYINFYNLYEAFDEGGKVKVFCKEKYRDASIGYVYALTEKGLKLEWDCVATARNRLRMVDMDEIKVEIVIPKETMSFEENAKSPNVDQTRIDIVYSNGSFMLLDSKLKRINANPLLVAT